MRISGKTILQRAACHPVRDVLTTFFQYRLFRNLADETRILVVEDDASLGRFLCDNLVDEGFDVTLAADGNRALKEGHAFKPDLILLDLTLPGLDGLEACRRLANEQSVIP
jgi:CheY-like chemotaxis protein